MSRMSNTTGRRTLAGFERSDATKAANAAIFHPRFGGPSGGNARIYDRTDIRENAAHQRYGWFDAHATDSVRNGCTANNAVATPAPTSRRQGRVTSVSGRARS